MEIHHWLELVGLNERIVRWLSRNQENELRNLIVTELNHCIMTDFTDDRTNKLRELIARIPA